MNSNVTAGTLIFLAHSLSSVNSALSSLILSSHPRAFPPKTCQLLAHINDELRRDGGEFASFLRHVNNTPRSGTITTEPTAPWTGQEFNIGSPKQRVERLLELGWEPEALLRRASPKVDEEALLSIRRDFG
jgi:hypothetical protein